MRMVFAGTEPMRFAAVSKTRAGNVQPATAPRADIVIARAGRPIARLVPVGSGDSFSTGEGDPDKPADGNAEGPRAASRDRGLFTVPDSFNDPLPDDLLDLFER